MDVDEHGIDGGQRIAPAAWRPSVRVTRFTFLRRTLLLNFYPVLTVAAGNLILLAVPQAREALGAFRNVGETTESLWANPGYWIFIAALAYWSLTAWYCARLLLARRFPLDNVGPCASHRFAAAVNAWLPRALGLLACVPITLWFALPGAPSGAWLAPALYSGVFLVLVVRRRHLLNRWLGRQALPARPWARSLRTPGPSVAAVLLMFAVSALVLAAVCLGREAAARLLGAPALLLFAFGSWTVFGSIVLVYLPKSAGWPSLALLPLFTALLASCWNENHFVARNGGPPVRAARPALAEDFRAWQAARGAHGTEPVYLVAAAGGASRAAFWSGTLLLELERQARSQGRRFAPNIYAMSGVSGGSLGLAAFAGSLAVGDPDYARTAAQVGAFLGQDYLAPLVGALLYPDLLARFWPLPCPTCDRSLALEGAWERGWAERFPLSPAADWFRRPLLAPGLETARLPRLIFNATSASEGRRVVQSRLAFAPPQAEDLFGRAPGQPSLDTSRLTLAQAVHNSARFPYVSPAALVATSQGEPWDYLVDGGYFENSGAATLNAMIAEILKLGLVRPEQLVVLVIENEPASQSEWICPSRAQLADAAAGPARRPLAVGLRMPWQARLRPGDKRVPPVPELSLPFFSLYQTRNARAQAAEEETTRLLGGCGAGRVIELRYPWTAEGRQPPLSWFLNGGTTRAMAGMLQRRHSEAAEVDAFLANWERIRSTVLGKPAP
ncbi:hypothetical protein AB595_11305 [Massilia sp. WF1]|nr:hypothetical protein AM586_14190 [Massilia sp. WG5]KLU36401.1 hypothetical protein AB595_11305 [Massilia sp. WF1]